MATKEPSAPMTLSDAVDAALGAADWLTEKDAAASELARKYAALVDAALATGEMDAINKAHAVAGPNLQKTLASLGLTPEARGELGAKDEKGPVNPLDELKAKRRAKAAG